MPASDHKRRLTAFVVAMAVLIATPLAVVATTQFTDVPTSSVHHDNIDWLKDAGVTSGCNPPDNDEYCPTDSVTRAQMATFMRNLATNQVVDAATAIEANHAATADNSDNADTLGGEEPSAYDTFVAGSSQEFDLADAGVDSDPRELVGVTFTAPADGTVAITGTAGRIVHSSGTFADVTIWAQHNDSSCDFGSRVPSGYTRATVAATGTEPLTNSAAFTLTMGISAGTHSLTLCASSVNEALIRVAGVTAVVSPSDGSVATLGTASTGDGSDSDR